MKSFIVIRCHPNLASWIKRQANNFQKELDMKVTNHSFEEKLAAALPDIKFETIIGKRKGRRGKVKVKSVLEI